MATWQATVLTLFPEMFPGPLGISLLGKALANGLWSLDVRDIREHGLGKHRTVDDTPAGGGPGMVMRADVAAAAIDAVERQGRPLIYLSPRGSRLTQARVREVSAGPGAILLCGRFEGLDQRVIAARGIEEISLGDFVLAGGEIAAMALIEASVQLAIEQSWPLVRPLRSGVAASSVATVLTASFCEPAAGIPVFAGDSVFSDRPVATKWTSDLVWPGFSVMRLM